MGKMTTPISEPSYAYARAPDGQLPPKCPRCGAVLAHFLQTASEGCPPVLQDPPPVDAARSACTSGSDARSAPAATPLLRVVQPVAAPMISHPAIFDHPRIGGKVTICVFLSGSWRHIHRRCLTSICGTVPPERTDLRVAVEQPVTDLLEALPVTKVYPAKHKYQAMREVFWDERQPISTPWIVWIDDNYYARATDWMTACVQRILADGPEKNIAMYGTRLSCTLSVRGKDPRNWFRAAEWWQNRPLQDARGNPSPNGSRIQYVSGGFFALSVEAIRRCGIPDKRLLAEGGDVCIGEQLWQHGYKVAGFNENRRFIQMTARPGGAGRARMPWQ